jgi:hypothetical protein
MFALCDESQPPGFPWICHTLHYSIMQFILLYFMLLHSITQCILICIILLYIKHYSHPYSDLLNLTSQYDTVFSYLFLVILLHQGKGQVGKFLCSELIRSSSLLSTTLFSSFGTIIKQLYGKLGCHPFSPHDFYIIICVFQQSLQN